jgi:hypothetical protein
LLTLGASNQNKTMREKDCERCAKDYNTMYRVKYKTPQEWVFLCKLCLLEVKKNNTAYRYGGTWKR